MTDEDESIVAGLGVGTGRLGVVACAAVALPLVLVAGGIPGAVLGGCDTVEHSPNVAVTATYADGTLSVTHESGDALGRDAAGRTTVLVGDGYRPPYSLPTEGGPYPLTSGDTVRVENVTLDGDPLTAGDRVAVRYEKRTDYPPYCLGRSEYVSYVDGHLAENGTVV